MLVKHIELVNFMAFEKAEADFTDGVIGIVGTYSGHEGRSNGSGKSCLLESILYALYGKTRDKDFIKIGKKSCRVQVILDVSGTELEVTRGRDGKTTALSVKVNGIDSGGSIKEKNEKIASIVGVDYSLMTAISFFLQEANKSFVTASPSERKNYLERILDLSRFIDLEVQSKAARESDKNALIAKRANLQYIEEQEARLSLTSEADLTRQLNECRNYHRDARIRADGLTRIEAEIDKSINDIKSTYLQLEQWVEDENKTLYSSKKQLEFTRETFRSVKSKIAEETIALEEKKERHADLVKISTVIEGELEKHGNVFYWNDLITKKQKQHYEVKLRMEQVEKLLEQKKKEKDSIPKSGAHCDKCGMMVEDGQRGRYESGMMIDIGVMSDNLKQMAGELALFDQQLSQYSENYTLAEEMKRNITNSSNKISEAASAIAASEEMLKKLDVEEMWQRLEKAEAQYETQVDICKALNERFAEFSKMKVHLGALAKQKPYVAEKKKEVAAYLTELGTKISEVNTKISMLQTIGKDKEQIVAQIAGHEKSEYIHDQLAFVFGKDGIRSRIIEGVIVQIEEHSNFILAELGVPFRLKLQTTKETLAGDERETLNVLINTPEGERGFESYSGGEKTMINFALRLALSRIISQQSGINIKSIFLDEITADLDDINRYNLVKILNLLKDSFSQIFVISHMSDVQGYIGNHYVVTKTATGSTLSRSEFAGAA